MRRRALTFAGRVLVLLAVLFGPMATLIVAGVLFGLSEQVAKGCFLVSMIWVMCALVLTPAILFPESGGSSGPPGGDGGEGDDPPQSPPGSTGPRGGIPLPDADQSRERIRDHDRPGRRRLRLRRPSREPERPTAPAPADE